MHPNIEKVLIDEKTLKTRIAEMAAEISKDYEGEELLVIGLLKGASYFMMELTQHLSVPTQIDFLKVSSYGSGTSTSGKVDIQLIWRPRDPPGTAGRCWCGNGARLATRRCGPPFWSACGGTPPG